MNQAIRINMDWKDIHSHFLPAMDDGCKSVEESIWLLSYSRKKGVTGIIATPHYYPRESIEKFLERRRACAQNLMNSMATVDAEFPSWCMGAEVAYYEGLLNAEGLEKLCLGKSRYMLLELPFDKWRGNIIRDLHSLSSIYNIIPILAHLERYTKYQDKGILKEVMQSDVMIQMNGEYILGTVSFRDAKKRIENENVHVLGSDCHNMKTRLPNLTDAVEKLAAKGMEESAEKLRQTNAQIFSAAMGND